MKNWIDIGGRHWEDHGGTWAKKAKDGSWYVLRFDNMLEAVGQEWEDQVGRACVWSPTSALA